MKIKKIGRSENYRRELKKIQKTSFNFVIPFIVSLLTPF